MEAGLNHDTDPLLDSSKKKRTAPRVHQIDSTQPKSVPLFPLLARLCSAFPLPLVIACAMLGSAVVSWGIAASKGHVSGIPRISQCGVLHPERVVLGVGFIFVGFSFVRFSRLVHWFLAGALPNSEHARYFGLSLSLLCAFTSLGVALAPFSQFEDETSLDELTCVLFLSLSLLCLLMHVALRSFHTELGKVQSILVVAGILFAVLFVALKLALPANSHHNSRTKNKNLNVVDDYATLKHVRAGLEWACVFSLCGFLISLGDRIRDDVTSTTQRVTAEDTMKGIV